MAEMAQIFACLPNTAFARGARAITEAKAQEALRSFAWRSGDTGWIELRDAEPSEAYLRGVVHELRRALGRNDMRFYLRFVPNIPELRLQAWMCLTQREYDLLAASYDLINPYLHLTRALSR